MAFNAGVIASCSVAAVPIDPIAVSIYGKMTSWWELDEASGTRVDSFGLNNLTLSGAEQGLADGVRGAGDPAANLNGAMSFYVPDTASVQSPSPAGDRVQFAWFYTTSTAYQGILFKWNSGTPGVCDRAVDIVSGDLRGFSANGGSYIISTSPAATIPTSTWHFVVHWRDSADGKERIQVDDGTIYVSAAASGANASTEPFAIGSVSTLGSKLQGRMQRVGWAKGAFLDATERTWLYNSGSGRTYAELAAMAGV
jgi:hypothetical protein